jgi:hypothetical protein
MQNVWPLQSEAAHYYGSVNAIEATQLVTHAFPYRMTYDHSPVKTCRVHVRCAPSLARVMFAILERYTALHGKSGAYDVMELDGVTTYDGTYCFRNMRGNSHAISMHAYGCAIDFDAEHNPRGHKGRFNSESIIVRAFKAEGWIWGGEWYGASCDPMHFQAARVG